MKYLKRSAKSVAFEYNSHTYSSPKFVKPLKDSESMDDKLLEERFLNVKKKKEKSFSL